MKIIYSCLFYLYQLVRRRSKKMRRRSKKMRRRSKTKK